MSVDRYDWRPKTSDIPTSPGVYRYMDGEGRVIYVGKALNLRSRLSSYFAAPETLHRRTALLMEDARAVQWTVVGNEVEALPVDQTVRSPLQHHVPRRQVLPLPVSFDGGGDP
mgnify:CR=1 FL=1